MVSDLGGSDAAGNAMGEGFAAIAIFLLYTLLAALGLVAVIGGEMPLSGRIATLLFVPASFGAVWIAFSLLTDRQLPPGAWPLAIPAGAPPLIIAYCLWALVAPLRSAVPERVAGILAWSGVALLCLAIVPLSAVRDRVNAREAARVADWKTRFDAMPADAPLWKWTPFLSSNVYLIEQGAGEAIRKLSRRQGDAEAMLDRDEFPFGKLSQFDLDPTPSLCEKARASLNRRAGMLASGRGPADNYAKIAQEAGAAAEGMQWLVGFACGCDQESLAWETLARAYGGSDYDVAEIVKLRDPGELGHILYNDPPRLSMLTPRANLRAWLNFAYGPGGVTEEAAAVLEGARKLDHRTADAVAWLDASRGLEDRFVLMRFLPELDLDATPAFCTAGLKAIGDELGKAYRPAVDNPLPYSELPERLGVGEPLIALKWFAGHGCKAEVELTAAEYLVQGYQDSPDRAAMLGELASLHRKP